MHRGDKFEMHVDNTEAILLENIFKSSKIEEQVDIPSSYTGIQMRYTTVGVNR